MPGGGVRARFYRPRGRGFELSFCTGGGEFAHQKNCPGEGWSGLELTDTLLTEIFVYTGNICSDAQGAWTSLCSVHTP